MVQKSSNAETALTKIRQEQSVVDAELRKLENARSIAELDLRSISEKVTQIKLDLKTYEINLQNSNESIKKSGINIDDINYSDYEDYVLDDLQDELANIQAKIIKLGAINLAAPEEIAEEREENRHVMPHKTSMQARTGELSILVKVCPMKLSRMRSIPK